MKFSGLVGIIVFVFLVSPAHSQYNFTYEVIEGEVTAEQLEIFDTGFLEATRVWDSVVLGHQDIEGILEFPIEVNFVTNGLASASPSGVRLGTSPGTSTPDGGWLTVNPAELAMLADGLSGTTENLVDDVLIHEIGHALGFGQNFWRINKLYELESGKYTGEFGLEAYRQEFDPDADFIPVELVGPSANSHWDQIIRSSEEEGNPDDPRSLSPLIGITDAWGRDLGQEIMSAALDADYGVPFLSNTTVQSLRDLGHKVVGFYGPGDLDNDADMDADDVDLLVGAINSQSDDRTFDLNWSQTVDTADLQAWLTANETVLGDANLDGRVDATDLNTVGANWRIPNFGGWSNGDFDNNGIIDVADLNQVGLSWRFGETQAVPEPTHCVALGILCLYGIKLMIVRRCEG